MSFYQLAERRYSTRNFSDRPVNAEQLEMILEAARLAPTAVNYFPVKIYVIKSNENLEKIRSLTPHAHNAPVVLMVCHDKDRSWKATNYNDDFDSGVMDASIVTTFMMMEATDLGLSSLWVRGFNSEEVSRAFDLPRNMVLDDILLIGYAAEDDEPSQMHYKNAEFNKIITEI